MENIFRTTIILHTEVPSGSNWLGLCKGMLHIICGEGLERKRVAQQRAICTLIVVENRRDTIAPQVMAHLHRLRAKCCGDDRDYQRDQHHPVLSPPVLTDSGPSAEGWINGQVDHIDKLHEG